MVAIKRDENFVPTISGVSSADDETPVEPRVDPADRWLHVGIISVTQATDFEGAPVTVGTTAVEMTFSGTTQVISLQSDHDNSGKIWIGKSNIDNTGANAFGRLSAGQSVEISLNDSSNAVFVVSDTASQTVFKQALI